MPTSSQLTQSFTRAVDALEDRFRSHPLADADAAIAVHTWLDGTDRPLPWAHPTSLTADEWFFVTTLYGRMTVSGQRAHIRSFFEPLFVRAARRDIRNFRPGLHEYEGLRAPWMAARLITMGELLRARGMTMSDYADWLRDLDRRATARDPMPAVDAIRRDHRATGWKTLSVFVRDCVQGNCFPIDSRVSNELARWNLPSSPDAERLLVTLSLAIGRNPRVVERMFYEAGGDATPNALTAELARLRAEVEDLRARLASMQRPPSAEPVLG